MPGLVRKYAKVAGEDKEGSVVQCCACRSIMPADWNTIRISWPYRRILRSESSS